MLRKSVSVGCNFESFDISRFYKKKRKVRNPIELPCSIKQRIRTVVLKRWLWFWEEKEEDGAEQQRSSLKSCIRLERGRKNMANDGDTASFTTRTRRLTWLPTSRNFTRKPVKTRSPCERFPTGWKIRRTSVPYTIARINLQMSFLSFCSIHARTARCKCAR